MMQTNLFEVPEPLKERMFHLRVECYIAYLKSLRERPDPSPAEIAAGKPHATAPEARA